MSHCHVGSWGQLLTLVLLAAVVPADQPTSRLSLNCSHTYLRGFGLSSSAHPKLLSRANNWPHRSSTTFAFLPHRLYNIE